MERMKLAMIFGLIILPILIVTSLSEETFPSPLFGSAVLGESFDDSTSTIVSPSGGLHTLHISYGAFVFGLQASYRLQNGGTVIGNAHGTIGHPTENSTILKFQEKETIIRIVGAVEQTYSYITRLKLYTKSASGLIKTYGPFGGGGSCDTTFTFTGAVVFLFGRSGEYLNALGVYINSLLPPMYNRTQMIGGIYGTIFDNYPVLTLGRVHILNMTINSEAYINGLKITYRLPNGTYFVSQPGQLGTNDDIIRFHDSEMIVQVDLAVFSLWVNYLMFSTLDSSGTRRTYGPYGDIPQSNITTIHGTVNGFFGRVGTDHNITAITGLGFYV